MKIARLILCTAVLALSSASADVPIGRVVTDGPFAVMIWKVSVAKLSGFVGGLPGEPQPITVPDSVQIYIRANVLPGTPLKITLHYLNAEAKPVSVTLFREYSNDPNGYYALYDVEVAGDVFQCVIDSGAGDGTLAR